MKRINAVFLILFSVFLFYGCALTPTPFIKASLEGRTEEVKSMLENGADINERGNLPNATRYAPKNWLKFTPLMAAAHYDTRKP